MEKRLLAAVVLSMAILLGTQYVIRRYFPAPQPPPAASAPPTTVKPAEPLPPPPSPPPVVGAVQAERKQITVESGDYVAVVDSQGGMLRSLQLKRYRTSTGEPIELIPQKVPPGNLPPLSLEVSGKPTLSQKLIQALYQVRIPGGGAAASRLSAPVDLELVYGDDQVRAVKTLKFLALPYTIEASGGVWEGDQRSEAMLLVGPDVGTEAGLTEAEFTARGLVVNAGGSINRELFADGKNAVHAGPIFWGGLTSKYFAALVLPDPPLSSLRVDRFDIKQQDAAGKEIYVPYYWMRVPAATPVKIYIGPTDIEVLERVQPGLSDVIDYGWFSLFVKPLLLSLKFIHRYVGNWGVAIIVLTFLISVALFPIRWKQMVSMKKMQALQPKMRSIQDRYKKYKRTDPKRQEMNAEIMQLYKEHGVNPLGGCLPLLLQMPFLFAFYRMLDGAIELRGAPFVFWIRDLSAMDPYYVTPVLMGVTMLIQQKMTPQTTMDPAQARMMMIMPVVFTAMFFTLSSGLVLYFLCSNLFAVGFQKLAEVWMPEEGQSKKLKKVKES